MIHSKYILAAILLCAGLFTACRLADPIPENSEELITQLTLTCTPEGGGPVAVFDFFDPDGDGGSQPEITGDTLVAQTSYSVTLTLLNTSAFPIQDVTAEILEEGEEHQFFFLIEDADIVHQYDDVDGNGDPIGLVNTFITGISGQGTLTVVLRHSPDKDAPNVSSGDITEAGGDTDLSVTFEVYIE